MNTYIDQLAAAVADRFVIETEAKVDSMSIFCRDLEGNLVTSRVFTMKQLRNASLVSLVMDDLKNRLISSNTQPAITPLPESLHPNAS